jgi:hypothetical protein
MTEISPAVLDKARSAIRDEGEEQGKKAGA